MGLDLVLHHAARMAQGLQKAAWPNIMLLMSPGKDGISMLMSPRKDVISMLMSTRKDVISMRLLIAGQCIQSADGGISSCGQ